MKKIAFLILSVFITISHLCAYANMPDNTGVKPLDLYERMEIGWTPMEQPIKDIFKSESEVNKFLDVLFEGCIYKKEKNVVYASQVELYTVCVAALKEITGTDISEAQREECMDFTILVTANVLGKEEMLKRYDVAQDERDANEIYKIEVSDLRDSSMLYTRFSMRLQAFIVNKYCKENKANIGCDPKPELECDLVENTKYLERDMQLYCNRSKWERYYENNKYKLRLKRE